MNKPYKMAVKAIIRDSAGRCLLIRRSPANKHFVGVWEWPGGKVDHGEDFAEAVVREAREETSLEVEITGIGGVTGFEMPAARPDRFRLIVLWIFLSGAFVVVERFQRAIPHEMRYVIRDQ